MELSGLFFVPGIDIGLVYSAGMTELMCLAKGKVLARCAEQSGSKHHSRPNEGTRKQSRTCMRAATAEFSLQARASQESRFW